LLIVLFTGLFPAFSPSGSGTSQAAIEPSIPVIRQADRALTPGQTEHPPGIKFEDENTAAAESRPALNSFIQKL